MTNVQLTQYGNPYQKTSKGKKVGLATGAIAGGVAGYKVMQEVLHNDVFYRKLADRFITKAGPNLKPEVAIRGFDRLVKCLPKCALAVGAAITGVLGLAIGAIVDRNNNHNRQVIADMTKNDDSL